MTAATRKQRLAAAVVSGLIVSAAAFGYAWRTSEPEVVTLPCEQHFVRLAVVEPSAVAYHRSRGTILIASDEGYFVELNQQFEPVAQYPILGDIEGIAVHPQQETIFLASEQEQAILEYDIERKRVVRTLVVDWPASLTPDVKRSSNQGLEGICFVPSDEGKPGAFVVLEADPALLVELEFPPSRRDSREGEDSAEAKSLGYVDRAKVVRATNVGFDRLSDVLYVQALDALVITSASERAAIVLSLGAKRTLRFRLPGKKPEGLVFLPNGDLLVVQDTGGLWVVVDALGALEEVFEANESSLRISVSSCLNDLNAIWGPG